MNFLSQTVIIVAMALLSLSASGISYLLLGLKLETAALETLCIFAVLVILQLMLWRNRDRRQTSRDLREIGQALSIVTRDIAVLNNKMNAYDEAGVLRIIEESAVIKGAVQQIESDMQQMTATLQQHYELIQLVRPPAVFGHKKTKTQDPQEAPPARQGRLSHLADDEAAALVRRCIDEGRLEIMLQPIVMLPQRKTRWYEVLTRIKTEKGDTLLPDDFLYLLAKGTLSASFDATVLYRAVQLVRRMQMRNKDVGVIVNLCAATLADGEEFRSLIEFLSANRALGDALVLEIKQSDYNDMGPLEFESLNVIAQQGFRFSLDQASDLRLDAKALADRGFRFVKVPADVLLGRAGELPSDIHPADLSNLLARYNIDLIAEKIETEATVIDLLDYDVKFAQGFLFSPPRPVKADVLGEEVAAMVEPRRASA